MCRKILSLNFIKTLELVKSLSFLDGVYDKKIKLWQSAKPGTWGSEHLTSTQTEKKEQARKCRQLPLRRNLFSIKGKGFCYSTDWTKSTTFWKKVGHFFVTAKCLQRLTNRQLLYWNQIGQNKLIQPKFWPTSSTSSEWSKNGPKDLILTSLIEASGRFQINGRNMARRGNTDQKLTTFCWMTSCMLSVPIIKPYIYMVWYFNPSSAHCQ